MRATRPFAESALWLGAFLYLAPIAIMAQSPRQFFGFENLSGFSIKTNGTTIECLSPVVTARFPWTELVPSWNVRFKPSHHLKIQARAVWPERTSSSFTLGLWSIAGDEYPRESVPLQGDEFGRVLTDTLVLKARAPSWQIMVTLAGGATVDSVAFLGVSVLSAQTNLPAMQPNLAAWGRVIDVPRKSQLNYPGGENEWCSPTAISMILNHWAAKLSRQELAIDVPEVVRGVNDPKWPGTGNWPFNTAFAGSFEGMRAYVTRLDDVAELKDWILAGFPVAASLSYTILKGGTDPGNGHLVVVAGFTDDGSVVVNDPGTRLDNVRRTFPRDAFARAWAVSKNTVYVVTPVDATPPKNRFGHWHMPRVSAKSPQAASPG